MGSQNIVITGDKESFFIRVLVKKMRDHGIPADFVSAGELMARGLADAGIVVYYMEEGEKLQSETLDLFRNGGSTGGRKLILIGLSEDMAAVLQELSGSVSCNTYNRPLDDEKFIADISMLMSSQGKTELKKSILIVDDEPGYMSLVREWLKESYRVSMVTDGQQAFKWLSKNRGDLILLDYEMPGLSGPEVLKAIKEDIESRDIPVFFLTGRSEKEKDSLISDGVEGIIFKTITKDELLARLDEFFAN